ncbi:alpha/beta hydrolase [[Phormidium] sp. ETS-05]|uniref:alpha/beta hydrolase n=1 Tax=[Phormidium] sp. ETS-05 TaxID=222819 RepID=UPI0018EF191B|nr:alpha/beta hydrolase [[Phormidium] sp. ETS-05]
MSLQAINIPPASGEAAKGLIVLLHGWGANLDDLASLAPELNLPDYHFLFPDAPFRHPQVPGGKMWYDLDSDNYEGLPESGQMLLDWLLSLEGITGVPLSRTILGGFSQGGAMTLDVGLRLPVAGLVSFSGYLHGEPEPTGDLPPVLMMHGVQDGVVPVAVARQAHDILTELGVSVTYAEFNIGHQIITQEIELMRGFVLEAIATANKVEGVGHMR